MNEIKKTLCNSVFTVENYSRPRTKSWNGENLAERYRQIVEPHMKVVYTERGINQISTNLAWSSVRQHESFQFIDHEYMLETIKAHYQDLPLLLDEAMETLDMVHQGLYHFKVRDILKRMWHSHHVVFYTHECDTTYPGRYNNCDIYVNKLYSEHMKGTPQWIEDIEAAVELLSDRFVLPILHNEWSIFKKTKDATYQLPIMTQLSPQTTLLKVVL